MAGKELGNGVVRGGKCGGVGVGDGPGRGPGEREPKRVGPWRGGVAGRLVAGLRHAGVWLGVLAVATSLTASSVAGQASPAPPARDGVRNSDPLSQYSTYIVATHFLRDQSYETHHYFKPLRDGVLQGLVFRTSDEGAPLIEVEWAISREVWERLPDWQKEYWHPLGPAVEAGRVRAPGLSGQQEAELLRTVSGLYAQTMNLAGLNGELPVGLEGVAMVTHITRAEMLRAMGMGGGR